MFEKQAHLPSANDDRRASNWALPHTDGSVTTDALLRGVDPRQACHRDGPRSDLRRLPENSYRRGGVVKRADRTRTTIFSHRDRRPDQAVPDGAPESLVSQMREKLIAGLHAAFLGGAADGLYFSCRRGRAGEAPGPMATLTPPTVGVGAALLTCPPPRRS